MAKPPVARRIAPCKLAPMMRRIALSILFAAACLAGAFADDAKLHYVNVWYGYAIDLPAGFSAVKESDNGDGGVSYSPDRKSRLAVWGANTMINSFQSDINDRISSAQDEGWAITYNKVTSNWASWSGTKDDRIFYSRAIRLCGDGAGYFDLRYPQEAKDAFDPVVTSLIKSFKRTSCN